jgi:hypothetical protein
MILLPALLVWFCCWLAFPFLRPPPVGTTAVNLCESLTIQYAELVAAELIAAATGEAAAEAAAAGAAVVV